MVFANNPIWFNDIPLDTPTVFQAAQMSEDVYNPYNKRNTKLDGGWERIKSMSGVHFENEETDFQSALYSRTVDGKTEYTFATAGTASLQDAKEDATQLVGTSGQYAISVKTAKDVVRNLPIGAEVTFTGHSLGGGTASANALALRKYAITFNAAGLSSFTKDNLKLASVKSTKIDAFAISGEAITTYQAIIGLKPEGKMHWLQGEFSPPTYLNPMPLQRGLNHTMDYVFRALNKAGHLPSDKPEVQAKTATTYGTTPTP